MDISEMTYNLPNTMNWMEQDDDSIVELSLLTFSVK